MPSCGARVIFDFVALLCWFSTCLVNSLASGRRGGGGGGGGSGGAGGASAIAHAGSPQWMASRMMPAKLPCPLGNRDMSNMR